MVRLKAVCCAISVVPVCGCTGSSGLFDPGEELADVVSSKAVDVAEHIGGNDGFGGAMMSGYINHVGPHMGFVTIGDLADADGVVVVRLENLSDQAATFHLSYFTAHVSSDDQLEDLVVPAGGEVQAEIPCAEIVGLGNLEMPGTIGCHLSDGQEIGNTFAVPMFHGLDYTCGETITFTLTPDADDLDGDGDADELTLLSEGFLTHLADGGPFGHTHMGGMMHGGFGGMVGFDMMRR